MKAMRDLKQGGPRLNSSRGGPRRRKRPFKKSENGSQATEWKIQQLPREIQVNTKVQKIRNLHQSHCNLQNIVLQSEVWKARPDALRTCRNLMTSMLKELAAVFESDRHCNKRSFFNLDCWISSLKLGRWIREWRMEKAGSEDVRKA